MKTIQLIIFLLLPIFVFAQTKPVAYRSHSGNMRYYAMATEPDNLGWGGPDPVVFTMDSMVLMQTPPTFADSATNYPYCNNLGVTQDTGNKHFPFYVSAMEKGFAWSDSSTWTPDTLATPKETIKTRNELKKNVAPVGRDRNNTGDGFNPSPGLLLIVGLVMLMIGSLIWISHRNKILPSH